MKLLAIPSLLMMLALPLQGLGQAGAGNAGAAGRQQPVEDTLTRDTLSQQDLKRLAEKIDQWSRIDGKKGVTPRVARERATAMLAALQVSCSVSDAAYRGQAPDSAAPHVYEAACEEGMGYLLELRGKDLTGVSCLADREGPAPRCSLPANVDGKSILAAVLGRQRIPCEVRDFKWLGSSSSGLDHVEAACEGGIGYVLRHPPPGKAGTLEVFNCQDSARQGIACTLTPTAVAAAAPTTDSRPTLAWFKQALSQNGVSCESKRARIIGRESIKRRYLVEFECTDHPEGLVAFVPSAGDTANSFESMSCAQAVARKIRCEWSGTGAADASLPR
jgi:hypothetical protein